MHLYSLKGLKKKIHIQMLILIISLAKENLEKPGKQRWSEQMSNIRKQICVLGPGSFSYQTNWRGRVYSEDTRGDI